MVLTSSLGQFGALTADLQSRTLNTEQSDAANDELLPEATAFVRESGRASISAIQRRFTLRYNRAARLVEALELAGVVSHMHPDGSRAVLQG
ncbi:DNA translocase FtsK [Pseudomonas sp. NPDC090208]|uniref:DNA translocase FtsK n=1 Tax=Pseudomonas sp. NPDC090208 TaxID=3364478 RepID=UPI00382CD0DB